MIADASSREREEPLHDVEVIGRKLAQVRTSWARCGGAGEVDGRDLLGSLTFAAMHRQAMKVTGLLEGLPLSLLGHSAGMALIYELCMHLKRHWGYRPQRVINVALPPPDVRTRSGQRASP